MTFKQHIIQDILEQIDYERFCEKKNLDETELREELQILSEQALLSWYFAFIAMRNDLVLAGYNLNGFKPMEEEKVREYLKSPDFQIEKVMF